MVKLNFPAFDFQIKKEAGKEVIFDTLRKKFVVLTPEEWVRQHFHRLLTGTYKYPKSLIKIETGVAYNGMPRRSDIVIYDRKGCVFMIVECKAPSVPITEKTFQQASGYSFSLKSPHLAVTNGLKTFCCSIDHEKGSYVFLDDMPEFR